MRLLAVAGYGVTRLWRVSDGTRVRTLADSADEVADLAFSPDGKWLALAAGSGSWSAQGALQIWHLADGSREESIVRARRPDPVRGILARRDAAGDRLA